MHVFGVVTSVIHVRESQWANTEKYKIQTFLIAKTFQKAFLLCNFRFPPEFPPNLCATEVDRFLGKTPGVGGLTCCQTSIPCTPTICPGEATASPWVDKHFRCLWRSDLNFFLYGSSWKFGTSTDLIHWASSQPAHHCSTWKLWESSRVSLTIIDTYRAPLTMAA